MTLALGIAATIIALGGTGSALVPMRRHRLVVNAVGGDRDARRRLVVADRLDRVDERALPVRFGRAPNLRAPRQVPRLPGDENLDPAALTGAQLARA